MASELRYLQQRYAEATFIDRTWQGRLFVLMRHVTEFYCIFHSFVVRFLVATHAPMYFSQPELQSLSNVFLPASRLTTLSGDPEPAPDLLASTLLLLVPHSSSPITETNITYAMRQENLVLVGATSRA